MHLFDVMYDLVDHVVTSQYLSEQRCKSPKQNSKLSPTYRKRAASCDSVGLFQVNIWQLCSNLLHPCRYSVCWSISYQGNLLKIPNSNCGLLSSSFQCCQLSLHISKIPACASSICISLWTLLSCVAALEQHSSVIHFVWYWWAFLGWCFLGFSFLSFCCSVTQLCSTLCDAMDSSKPGSSVLSISWSLLKLMSIELVMPFNHLILSLPSPPALNLSQHQGLFQWIGSSHQVAKVLELQLQYQSFQWIFGTNFL